MFDPVKEHQIQQNFVDWIERLNGGAVRRIEWENCEAYLTRLPKDARLY